MSFSNGRIPSSHHREEGWLRHQEQVAKLPNRRSRGGVPFGFERKTTPSSRKLDRHAALDSTSWGMGQIMGFNSAAAGFKSAEEMVSAMVQNEDSQLLGMANFLKTNNLAVHLVNRAWDKFARAYNGPDFKKNKYDEKLNAAFANFSAGPLPQIKVRQTQVILMFLGFNVGVIDGIVGNKTRDSIRLFRQQQRMPPSDAIDDGLIAALRKKLAAKAAGG